MAEKASIKKVSAEKLAQGIYEATFTGGTIVTYEFGKLYPGFAEMAEVPKKGICYGWKQKLDDSMAGAADEKEAIEELQSTVDALDKGKWTMRVAGEGEAGGLFARALSEARSISLADAKTKIAEVVEKNKAKNPSASDRSIVQAIRNTMLQSDTAFAAAYKKLQDERAAKVNTKLTIEL